MHRDPVGPAVGRELDHCRIRESADVIDDIDAAVVRAAQKAWAALPLAEGYSVTYRTLDLMAQKEKLMQLKVAAVESVRPNSEGVPSTSKKPPVTEAPGSCSASPTPVS